VGILRRLLGGPDDSRDGVPDPGPSADDAEWRTAREATFDAHADRHRVTLWLRLSDAGFEDAREQLRVFALEDRLMRALDASGAGEHDTNTLEPGFYAIRLVSTDADAVLDVVRPLLIGAPPGSYLAVRRGPAGSGEDREEV
jgi:hypothetical protein